MARCLTNEKYVRPVYYGAMVAEGIVACVWATAGIAAFPGGYVELKSLLDQGGPGLVVNQVATTYLGVVGGIMAVWLWLSSRSPLVIPRSVRCD